MWKAEGFAGFMKGNGINVVRVRCGGFLQAKNADDDRYYHTPLYNLQYVYVYALG